MIKRLYLTTETLETNYVENLPDINNYENKENINYRSKNIEIITSVSR